MSKTCPSAPLQDSLTALSLGSQPSGNTHRPFGFNDYTPVRRSSPPSRISIHTPNLTPSRKQQSSPVEGSPMEVDSGPDSGSPEAADISQSRSIFTTAALWSTGMKFVPSPPSETAPNPYSIKPKPSDVPVIDLSRESDGESDHQEDDDVVVVKTEKTDGDNGKSETGDKRRTPRTSKNTKKLPSKRKSTCLSTVCYCQMFIVILIIIVLGILFMADLVKTKMCERNQGLNVTAIQQSLQQQVFGQHIALEMVVKALEEFMESQRTMVLSFHGWTGIGKTFVSTIITNHIATPSLRTVFIPQQFPHSDEDNVYQGRIYDWIMSNITSCAVNVFIIDEMDKATEGVSRGLASVLADIRELDLNNSRILVIMISNTGGGAINRDAFRHLERGYDREQLLGSGLIQGIFTDYDAEWLQMLNNSGVIDHIVPFLPLERDHVKLCVEAYVKALGYYSLDSINMDKILDDFVYLPKDFPIFSKSGCRQVNTKVDLVADSGHAEEPREEL